VINLSSRHSSSANILSALYVELRCFLIISYLYPVWNRFYHPEIKGMVLFVHLYGEIQ
jgi:hypothetical protein